MEAILRAASEAAGVELSEPVDLGGNPRSTVLRCRTADGDSVVVKAYAAEPDALRGFVAEAAALSLGLAGPELLGVDPAVPLVVMADLGTAPTLADVLLGDDPEAAVDGLLAWAGGLGRLAAASMPRRADFAELRGRYGGALADQGRHAGLPADQPRHGTLPVEDESWIPELAPRLFGLLDEVGVAAPPGLAEDLALVGTVGRDDYPAFTPGDTCPDNNLLSPGGLRLIDFESAAYESVFLTAAYCRMPFSSCWCVFTLPDDMAERIEDVYRAEVVTVYPALADDAVWDAGVRRAVAAWTTHMTVFLLPRVVEEDRFMHRTRRPVSTMRQVLRHRWEMASALTELPAFAETMRLLLREVAGSWKVTPLPGYPAFGG
ncbi:hypothetical protein [Streptosporangium pseudovulgare]|uniref:Aminoglycoside phosphotransferase domain-containing protein n=1 Tax=Streptosporangium pseudovulgare TaxID=35765 RepID=A0ABQ2QZG2_9ACTN|nr:hypothetical protein [Streptosporangium pseudovulgare]GGQ02310.1 hypothetical protein GCM10010140_35500 [Streptosporangium pseudovulgare]